MAVQDVVLVTVVVVVEHFPASVVIIDASKEKNGRRDCLFIVITYLRNSLGILVS